jgi:hypothetical protein
VRPEQGSVAVVQSGGEGVLRGESVADGDHDDVRFGGHASVDVIGHVDAAHDISTGVGVDHRRQRPVL